MNDSEIRLVTGRGQRACPTSEGTPFGEIQCCQIATFHGKVPGHVGEWGMCRISHGKAAYRDRASCAVERAQARRRRAPGG
jgi:hypothetical protein